LRLKNLAIFLFLVAAPAAFAVCDGQHEVCGLVYKLGATYSSPEPAPEGYVVHICDDPHGLGEPCIGAQTMCGPPFPCNQFQAGGIVNNTCGLPIKQYWVFVASSEGWGNTTIPIYTYAGPSDCNINLLDVNVPPAPLNPTVIYPAANAILSSTSVNLKWNSGIDAVRNKPEWPATYDVFVKHWYNGESEPMTWGSPVYSGPCNPWGNGTCQATISTTASGNYKAKVVAKLDVSSSLVPALRPAVFTNSHSVYFWENTGRCFGCR